MTDRFTFSSVFIKTFVMLCIASLVLLLVFNVSFIGFYNKTFEQRLFASNLNMVTKTRDYLDLILRDVVKEANLLSQDNNVINLAVVPSLARSNRNHSIVSRLRSVVAENRYIKSAYIYIPTGELVFSSTEGITPLASFSDRHAIVPGAGEGPRSGTIRIRTTGPESGVSEALTLYKDFPKDGPWRLAQIIVNLNTEVLNDAIRNQSDVGSDELVVVDGANAVTLGNYRVGTVFDDAGLSRRAGGGEPGYRTLAKDGKQYVLFHSDSAVVDWRRIYRIEQDKDSMFRQMAFSVFFPASIVFLLISVVFAWVLSKNLYRPVYDLARLVLVGEDPEKPAPGTKGANEYELIGARFSGIVERNERLEEVVEKTIPLIKVDFFSMLLHSDDLDNRDISFFGEYLDIDDYRRDSYVVFIVGLKATSESTPADLVEQRFALLKIKDAIKRRDAGFERIVCSSSQQRQIRTVCRFGSRVGDPEIRTRLLAFLDELKAIGADGAASVVAFSVGEPRRGIEGIAESYAQAQEAMKYSLYIGADGIGSIDGVGQDAEAAQVEARQISIREIVAAVGSGEVGQTSERVAAFFAKRAKADGGEPSAVRHAALQLVDSIAQSLITSNVGVDAVMAREKEVFRHIEVLEATSEIIAVASAFSTEAAHSALRFKATRHSRYVIKAREYVEENYADCDLSLNSAAAHVGFNSSYLSTLFKTETHESFIDFINRLRIRKARELLDNTLISVKEAGYAVGFNTIHNFIRTFKKFEGTTPGKYNEAGARRPVSRGVARND